MATLSDLTKKLNHPLEEVRQRSARSLRSKLDAGFFALHDLALEPSLPLNLVHMLGLPAVLPPELHRRRGVQGWNV